jgi:Flp pilus assembly protein TadD
VHYPAGEADLRRVMEFMPLGALDGLQGIVLCLGSEYQAESDDAAGCDSDPYTGRLGITCLPNVYTRPVLATYDTYSATIYLYAYAYDRESMPDREVRELYLRLCMLSTFFHEVAHHQDSLRRVARGRWRAEAGDKAEEYAESQGSTWLREIGAPYLEAEYPQAADALFEWTGRHGGIGVTLSLLAATEHQLLLSVGDALERLVSNVDSGEPLRRTRLHFARGLRFASCYQEALQSVATVLAEHPDDAEALALQSAIFARQRNFREAEEVARRAVTLDNGCIEAWKTLEDACHEREDWAGLAVAARHALALEPDTFFQLSSCHNLARALIELSDFETATAEIDRLAAARSRWYRTEAEVLRALLYLRQHDEAAALALVDRIVSSSPKGSHLPPALAAIRFEAASALGRDTTPLALSADDLARLARSGDSAWASRLRNRAPSEW